MGRMGIMWVIVLLLVGCKQTEYVTMPSVERDSIYITKTERDSLFVRDSVFVKDKGDTVFVEKWKTIYKSRVSTDTMYIERTDSIPYPVEVIVEKKYIPEWMWRITLFGVACAVLVGVKVVRKIGIL